MKNTKLSNNVVQKYTLRPINIGVLIQYSEIVVMSLFQGKAALTSIIARFDGPDLIRLILALKY